jgi:hypothetical protein
MTPPSIYQNETVRHIRTNHHHHIHSIQHHQFRSLYTNHHHSNGSKVYAILLTLLLLLLSVLSQVNQKMLICQHLRLRHPTICHTKLTPLSIHLNHLHHLRQRKETLPNILIIIYEMILQQPSNRKAHDQDRLESAFFQIQAQNNQEPHPASI